MTPLHRLDLLSRRAAVTKSLSRRSFNAAATNRLTNDWRSSSVSLDGILSGEGDTLRARSRDLSQNGELMTKFISLAKCNIAGEHGMTHTNKAAEPLKFQGGEVVKGELDKLANAIIEEGFYEWGKKENCTVSKDLSWLQVQHLAIEEWATCGETLWEMVIGPAAENDFGFALRPIAIDRLHSQSNYNMSNGDCVRLGVQKNKDGRVRFYWITDSDPTDYRFSRGNSYEPKAHDAAGFVHLFLRRRIGQSRGYPWATASMMRMKMLAGYDVATITAAETAACKMAFITKNGTGQEYEGPKTDEGGKFMDSEPGLIEELPQGMGVEVVDWNQPSSNYDPFTKACIRGIASGLLVSYPTLANDYAEINFSSGRLARMEETEAWKMGQSVFSLDFCEPIFAKWLEMSLANQTLKFPGTGKALPLSQWKKFNQPYFRGRRWGWVDPTKEVAAIAEELRLKLTSVTRICAERGIDRDELFQEIEADKKAAEARGIVLPDEAELAAAAQKLSDQDAAATAEEDKEKKAGETNGNRFHLNGNSH